MGGSPGGEPGEWEWLEGGNGRDFTALTLNALHVGGEFFVGDNDGLVDAANLGITGAGDGGDLNAVEATGAIGGGAPEGTDGGGTAQRREIGKASIGPRGWDDGRGRIAGEVPDEAGCGTREVSGVTVGIAAIELEEAGKADSALADTRGDEVAIVGDDIFAEILLILGGIDIGIDVGLVAAVLIGIEVGGDFGLVVGSATEEMLKVQLNSAALESIVEELLLVEVGLRDLADELLDGNFAVAEEGFRDDEAFGGQ